MNVCLCYQKEDVGVYIVYEMQQLSMSLYYIYHHDKFHIQWCLYTMMDLWNTINDDDDDDLFR